MAKIVVDFLARTGAFNTDTDRARKQFERNMKRIEREAQQVGKALGIAFATAATAMAAMTKKAIDAADEIGKLSRSVGVSVETLSTLAYAAERSGLDVDKLGAAMVKLTKNASDAAQDTGEARDAFRAMGIDVKDAQGNLKDADRLLGEIADKFATYRDGANKTALAVQLFGRAGAQMIPFLNEGSAGIGNLTSNARALGLELDTNTTKLAEQFNDNLTDLSKLAQGFANDLARELLPAMTALSGQLVESGKEARKGGTEVKVFAEGLKFVAKVAIELTSVLQTLGYMVGMVETQLSTLGRGIGEQFANVREFQRDILEIGPIDAATKLLSTGFDTAARNIDKASNNFQTFKDLVEGSQFEALKRLQALDTVAIPTSETESTGTTKRDAPLSVRNLAKATKQASEDIAKAENAIQDAMNASAEARNQALTDWQALTATLSGPLAEAENDHINRLQDIEELGVAAGKSAAEIARLKALEVERYNDVTEAIKAQRTPLQQLLEDLEREAELLKLGSVEREFAARTRGLSAEELEKEGARIRKSIEELQRMDELTASMDQFRDSTSDAFASFIDGTKSASDAINDFLRDIEKQIARSIANNFTSFLFGDQGQKGGGQFGNLVSGILGAFGGARADGGPVYSGKTYLVGERGPELFTPSGNGSIVPNHKMGGGGNITTVINVQPTTNRESATQIAVAAGERIKRQLARSR